VVEGGTDRHKEFFKALKMAYGYNFEELNHCMICRPVPPMSDGPRNRA
jgi:hypothetical protein